jgi:hypothetical protein
MVLYTFPPKVFPSIVPISSNPPLNMNPQNALDIPTPPPTPRETPMEPKAVDSKVIIDVLIQPTIVSGP